MIIQTTGRVLRPEENKIAIVADYVDLKISMLDYRAKQRLVIFKNDIFAKVVSVPPWRKEETLKLQIQDQAPSCIKNQSEVPGLTQDQAPTCVRNQSEIPGRNQSEKPFRKQRSLFDLHEKQPARPY
jgi:hypothetical protein